MKYPGKRSMAGKYAAYCRRFFILMVTVAVISGCRLPSMLKWHAENPHSKGQCNVCHEATYDLLETVEKGEGSEADLEAARALKSGPDGLCVRCHEPGEGDHAIGKVPSINRHDLPLDAEGQITCALTCHDVHTKEIDDPVVAKGLLRLHPRELCFSCHDL